MNEEQQAHPQLIKRALQLLSKQFNTNIEISAIDFLSKPERRNRLLRLVIKRDSPLVPKTISLKQSLPEKENDDEAYARFARDWAGLEFASAIPHSSHNTPHFYGGDKEQRFILIEDLGHQHVSLVDALTLPDRNQAVSALIRFMKALGSFHAAGRGHTHLYESLYLFQ